MSLVRGGTDVMTIQQGLEQFRDSNIDLRDWHLGDGARRMSITNAIDILRRHVLRAIKKKKDRHLVNLIFDHFTNLFFWYRALNSSFDTSGGQCWDCLDRAWIGNSWIMVSYNTRILKKL